MCYRDQHHAAGVGDDGLRRLHFAIVESSSAPVRIAHLSQIQMFVTDAALPAGIASICQHRGIEVIVAMPNPTVDLDEAGIEPASTVRRLR